MPKLLRVADGLPLPLDTITETLGVLAKKGAGKTHTAVVLGEELLGNNLQTVIVDPVGVWWGLRSSKDGKKNGLPIVIMGGEHGDVPLEHTAGAFVARLVVEEGISVLLDLSLTRKGQQRTFVTDFLEEIYRLKAKSQYRTPLHVILDEADAFAPQKVHHGRERCLGAVDDLVRRGRARGIGTSLITQRAAVINKDVLSQSEILVVLRTTSPQDRKAVEAWTDVHGEEEQTKEMMSSLPRLKKGQAWIWWPHNDYFKLVQVRDRHTFDSSRTPKVGEKIRKPKKLAPVDLKRIKVQMQETVERVKQDDPKELKKRIAELTKQVGQKDLLAQIQAMSNNKRLEWFTFLAKTDPALSKLVADKVDAAFGMGKEAQKTQIKKITVPAIGKRTIIQVQKSVKDLDRISKKLNTMSTQVVHAANHVMRQSALLVETMNKVIEQASKPPAELQELVDREIASRRLVQVRHLGPAKPMPDHDPGHYDTRTPVIKTTEPKKMSTGNVAIQAPEDAIALKEGPQRMLKALAARHPVTMSKGQWARMTGYTTSGGTFIANVAKLKNNGLIAVRDREVSITEAGFGIIGGVPDDAPTTPVELREMWRGKLNTMEWKILEWMLSVTPSSPVQKPEIANAVGYAVGGGSFIAAISALKKAGLLEEHRTGRGLMVSGDLVG